MTTKKSHLFFLNDTFKLRLSNTKGTYLNHFSHLTVNNNNAPIGRTFCFSFNPRELLTNAGNVS